MTFLYYSIFAAMEYFKSLLDLLKAEREEDQKTYQNLTEASSAAERRANGISWYPIAIRNSEMSRGDYLTLEMERTTHQDVSHQFRFGSSVSLFSNHDAGNDNIEGTVTAVYGNLMKVNIRTEELPDWSRNGKLGIDLLFDNNSYEEMHNALKQAIVCSEDQSTASSNLIQVLTGNRKPGFTRPGASHDVPTLNEDQQEAVLKIVRANELAIIHGPPGTGKTTTLVQAIKMMSKQNNLPILVVAPSNTAVDLLSAKLAQEGLDVLRIGNPSRVSEKMLSMTLDMRIAAHKDMKDIRALKKQAAEFKNMAHKYKRNFGRAEQEQRKALFNEAHKIMKEVANTEKYISDQVIAKAQVITATLIGANHHSIRHMKFDTVVIDEAGQALEPACWVPILKAEKVVFAGDHHQLPPTIKSTGAVKRALSSTLLEKCVTLHPESVLLLKEQYRMHCDIMEYSSRVFYGGLLKANENVGSRLLFAGDAPLLFVDTAGCGFEEKQEGTSLSNPEEAGFILNHLHQYINELKIHYSKEQFPSIGIISPYQQQVKMLKEAFANHPELYAYADHVSINSVDSFQGQERDIMYIGLTRSNSANNIGFLADTRRINVAMTRAKQKLVIVGDSATLGNLQFYSDLMTFTEEKNAYKSAWEYVFDS